MFFDDHPAFLESSTTASGRRRLNLRHRAIIETNTAVLSGATVLDIASHDGRWTCATLEAGARQVIGVEARPALVKRAEANMSRYGLDPEQYEFRRTDIFDVLTDPPQVDVVLLCGFLYHTLRWPELFTGLRRTGAAHVIIDTNVLRNRPGRLVRIRQDQTGEDKESNSTSDAYTYGGFAIVGRPTPSALNLLLQTYGFEVTGGLDWRQMLAGDNDRAVGDYRAGGRVTLLARRTG